MKKFLKITALSIMIADVALAQSGKIENIMKINLQNMGYIMEGKILKGYYTFWQTDKLDKKNNAYSLQIMDDNLGVIKTIDLVRPKNSLMLETTFNSNCFMFTFISKDDIELVTYDKTGKEVGTKKINDISRWERARLQQVMTDGEANNSVFPVGSGGFVRQTFTKNDKLGYAFEAYNNDCSVRWTTGSDPNSDKVESADVIFVSEKYIIAGVAKKPNMLSKDADMFVAAFDATNGKRLFEVPLGDAMNDMSYSNGFADETGNEIVIVGEYFNKGDKILKAKSVGLYVTKLDLTGKQIQQSKLDWTKDFGKFVGAGQTGKKDDQGYTYFHKIVKTTSGELIAIGEKYKKTIGAGGVAMKMLGGRNSGTSAFSLYIDDMVAMELDKDYKLKDYRMFEKNKSEVLLPSGAEYMGSTMLAHYVKAKGGFDYAFTMTDPEKDRVFSMYVDAERTKDDSGNKASKTLGTIVFADNKLSSDKMPLFTDANVIKCMPAKPGNVLILEHYTKKKMLTFRLEKVNF